MPENLGCYANDPVANFLAQNILGIVTDLLDHFIEFQLLVRVGSKSAIITQQSYELPE